MTFIRPLNNSQTSPPLRCWLHAWEVEQSLNDTENDTEGFLNVWMLSNDFLYSIDNLLENIPSPEYVTDRKTVSLAQRVSEEAVIGHRPLADGLLAG